MLPSSAHLSRGLSQCDLRAIAGHTQGLKGHTFCFHVGQGERFRMQALACADRGQAVVSWPSDIWRAVIWMALIGRKPSVVNSASGRIGPVDRCCITLTVDFMEPAVLYKGKPLLIKMIATGRMLQPSTLQVSKRPNRKEISFRGINQTRKTYTEKQVEGFDTRRAVPSWVCLPSTWVTVLLAGLSFYFPSTLLLKHHCGLLIANSAPGHTLFQDVI